MYYKDVLELAKGMQFDATKRVEQETVVKLFAIYLSSNPDFKYNQTYFTDSIDDFFYRVNNFKNKYSLCNLVVKSLLPCLDKYENKPIINVLFDGFLKAQLPDDKIIKIIDSVEHFRFYEISNEYLILSFEAVTPQVQQYILKISYKSKDDTDICDKIKPMFEYFLSTLDLKERSMAGKIS